LPAGWKRQGEAEVRIESLPLSHPLAGARNEDNRFLVTDAQGQVHAVYGKGAGGGRRRLRCSRTSWTCSAGLRSTDQGALMRLTA
jgi:hypothetical protein